MSQEYRSKPMTLYVNNNGVEEVDPSHYGKEMERIIDIQLSEADAIILRDMLSAKLNVEVYGAVSFRLKGRLIL